MAKRIDVSGMTAYYGSHKAIEDISMTVEPRSVTAFIGPSGCGKSTLMKLATGLQKPKAGTVIVRAGTATPGFGSLFSGRAVLEMPQHGCDEVTEIDFAALWGGKESGQARSSRRV